MAGEHNRCTALCVLLLAGFAASLAGRSFFPQSHFARSAAEDVHRWFTSLQLRGGGGNSTCPCSNASLCEPVKVRYNKEVFAFSTHEDNWRKYPYDLNLLTTIGVTYATSPKFDPQMVCNAHAHNVRVVALVDFPKSQLLNDSARAQWVKQTLTMARTLHLDGVNLDFEESISILEVAQREALTALTSELYNAFKSWSADSQVSFDTPVSPTCSVYGRCFDYAGLAKFTDFLFLMAYDESGSRKAYANSMYDSAVKGVKQFLALGISPKKVVLGLPWYGYVYRCSYFPPGGSCPLYTPLDGKQVGYADIQANYLSNQSVVTSGRLFDYPSLSPYVNFKDSSGSYQAWYDDVESLSYKIVFARAEDLYGVGMWTADTLDYSDSPAARRQQRDMWGSFLRF